MSETPNINFEKLSQELVDKGKLIEAGWIALRAVWLHRDSPPNQIDELRHAFFAGAQHLYASIMYFLEADAEPTEKDLERMGLIDAELRIFIQDFELRHLPTQGKA